MRDSIAAARRNPNAARKIAVDAMGGDLGPEVVVRGSVDAVNRLGTPIILVGDQGAIERELSKITHDADKIEIQHCTQVAGMDESPSDVLRRKKDSSIYVAFELVRQGRAAGAVSAGNSGATMAVGAIVLGRVAGVERPAIAGVFPTRKKPTVVIDIGANVDCKPSFLYQFGIMGDAYAREVLKIDHPRVGLLSIGEEEGKGNELSRRAYDLLKAGDINFVGNVEGRDVFSGRCGCGRLRRLRGQRGVEAGGRSGGDVDLHAEGIPHGRLAVQIRRSSMQTGVRHIQTENGLFGIWRRAAPGSRRRGHHQPRPVVVQGDHECHTRRQRDGHGRYSRPSAGQTQGTAGKRTT